MFRLIFIVSIWGRSCEMGFMVIFIWHMLISKIKLVQRWGAEPGLQPQLEAIVRPSLDLSEQSARQTAYPLSFFHRKRTWENPLHRWDRRNSKWMILYWRELCQETALWCPLLKGKRRSALLLLWVLLCIKAFNIYRSMSQRAFYFQKPALYGNSFLPSLPSFLPSIHASI